MNGAEATCDRCTKKVPMEQFNGTTNYRMPEYWVTVHYMISPHGLHGRGDKTLKDFIKETVLEMLPQVHLCPDCNGASYYLAEKARKKEEHIVKIAGTPARKVATDIENTTEPSSAI